MNEIKPTPAITNVQARNISQFSYTRQYKFSTHSINPYLKVVYYILDIDNIELYT